MTTLIEYRKKFTQISEYIENEDYENARKILNELKKELGENDLDVLFYNAQLHFFGAINVK